jgi:isopenicillin N synthase-like dioxygenase
VDFSQMSSSSLKERKAIAEQVGSAFRNSGFLYAVNHGISRDLQDRLTRVIQEFFALDEEEKMKVRERQVPLSASMSLNAGKCMGTYWE